MNFPFCCCSLSDLFLRYGELGGLFSQSIYNRLFPHTCQTLISLLLVILRFPRHFCLTGKSDRSWVELSSFFIYSRKKGALSPQRPHNVLWIYCSFFGRKNLRTLCLFVNGSSMAPGDRLFVLISFSWCLGPLLFSLSLFCLILGCLSLVSKLISLHWFLLTMSLRMSRCHRLWKIKRTALLSPSSSFVFHFSSCLCRVAISPVAHLRAWRLVHVHHGIQTYRPNHNQSTNLED